MEEKRYINRLLSTSKKFDIERLDRLTFYDTHVAFEGTPKKHSTDRTKVILLTDPFSQHNIFYEFPISAIEHIEELGTISSEDGRSAAKLRLWIKKGVLGIKYEPFII